MPTVTMTTTITIPYQTVGFEKSSPENAIAGQTVSEWTAAQTGFISQEYQDSSLVTESSARTRTYICKWSTFEDYTAYVAARSVLPEILARKAYNQEHGITSVTVETIE